MKRGGPPTFCRDFLPAPQFLHAPGVCMLPAFVRSGVCLLPGFACFALVCSGVCVLPAFACSRRLSAPAFVCSRVSHASLLSVPAFVCSGVCVLRRLRAPLLSVPAFVCSGVCVLRRLRAPAFACSGVCRLPLFAGARLAYAPSPPGLYEKRRAARRSPFPVCPSRTDARRCVGVVSRPRRRSGSPRPSAAWARTTSSSEA